MQDQPYKECRRIERTHVCAVCKGGLVTVWDGEAEAWAIRCSEGWDHSGYKRMIGYREARQIGLPIPLEVEQQFQREEERKMAEDKDRGSKALTALIPREDAGNNKLLAPDQVQLLIDYATTLGLDPYLRHVDLYFGQPRVTIYGWYYHARRQPEYGWVRTRALTPNERHDQKLEDHVHAWIAKVMSKDLQVLGEGYGYAQDKEEGQLMRGVSEEWATPQRRAEKRAEEDALAKAFPIGLPVLGEEESAPETVNDRKDDPEG